MAASKKDNVNAGRVEYLGDDREGKLAALNNAVAAIEKNYGKGSIMKLGDSGANIDIEAIPTGSISLDVALGVGGVPRGRIIEIYGPESSGKTTVALHMIAEAQKRNGIAGFIDAEHALDPQYAKKIGVDIDNLYISQPDNGEQALEIAETMIRSGALDIVIVDSVAALVPKAEIEGDMDDQQVGLHARLMSKAMRKLTGVINRSNCAVVFINHFLNFLVCGFKFIFGQLLVFFCRLKDFQNVFSKATNRNASFLCKAANFFCNFLASVLC